MIREGRVFDSLNLKPVFGVGYSVVVLEPGAEVAVASSGTTIDVQPGHGFANGDRLIVDLDVATLRRVMSVTPTTVEVNNNLPVAAGQLLVNLGTDTGSTGPAYDGSGATIYTDSGYVNTATNSTVPTAADGRFRYWHKGIERWEIVLDDDLAPLAIFTDTGLGSLDGPATTTDNSVPRFDGTDGALLQGSGVTIDDSDNLDIPGALSVAQFSTFAAGASIAGDVTLNGPGVSLAVANEQTVGGALSVGGLLTCSTTLEVDGASSFGGDESRQPGAGVECLRGYATELLTLSTSGATTNTSASLLPAGAIILGLVGRVTTTIATATDWKLGDSTTAARFCPAQSGAQLTAGATVVGLDHWSGAVTTLAAGPSQATATTVRVTTTGTPSAGQIRIGVFYLKFTAPIS